jgi:hypothetical protein
MIWYVYTVYIDQIRVAGISVSLKLKKILINAS